MYFIVISPVVDLRRERKLSSVVYEKDPLQETQLLYGEILMGNNEGDGWVYVEALEQQKFLKSGEWQGYPGWVERKHLCEIDSIPIQNLVVQDFWAPIQAQPVKNSSVLNAVSMGTKLTGIEEFEDYWIISIPENGKGAVAKSHVSLISEARQAPQVIMRKKIIETGSELCGAPYHWGGRSVYNPQLKYPLTSLDCSGYTNLLYRMQGMDIARDAHDQHLQAAPLEYPHMQAGDLIFLADVSKPHRMDHVMLFNGNDDILESTLSHNKIRKTTGSEKVGMPLHRIKNGQNVGQYLVFFGTMFEEKGSQ